MSSLHRPVSLDLLDGICEYLEHARTHGNGELLVADAPLTSLVAASASIDAMTQQEREQLAQTLTGLLNQHGSYAVSAHWSPPA